MLVRYEDYTGLGYVLVPEPDFPAYNADAEAYIKTITFGRIKSADDLDEMNKRGICRLIDLYYMRDRMNGESGAPIASFKNSDYSESYDTNEFRQSTFNEKAAKLIETYFTSEQLYRGIDQ